MWKRLCGLVYDETKNSRRRRYNKKLRICFHYGQGGYVRRFISDSAEYTEEAIPISYSTDRSILPTVTTAHHLIFRFVFVLISTTIFIGEPKRLLSTALTGQTMRTTFWISQVSIVRRRDLLFYCVTIAVRGIKRERMVTYGTKRLNVFRGIREGNKTHGRSISGKPYRGAYFAKRENKLPKAPVTRMRKFEKLWLILNGRCGCAAHGARVSPKPNPFTRTREAAAAPPPLPRAIIISTHGP